MTWFKTTDTLMTDEKVMMMPLAERGMALGTWIACGTWSAQHLTDGKVPSGVVESFVGTLDGAETLVRSRMWKRNRGGYVFNNWAKYQFTREQVEDKREQERARKAEARERAKAKHQAKGGNVPPMSQWDTSGTSAVSDTPVPTRPDPSRPVPTHSSQSPSPGGSPKQRATGNPQPCGEVHDVAKSCGACADARRAHESEQAADLRAKRTERQAAVKARAAAAKAAIEACDFCDDRGYTPAAKPCATDDAGRHVWASHYEEATR